MMKKKCELCGDVARMYCESDQASLCWGCDQKVHGANFLVAKHTRCLLCTACHSPTPWKASGPRLGPTVSACDSCISGAGLNPSEIRIQDTNGHDLDVDRCDGVAESYDDGEEDEEDDDEYSDEDDDDEDDEEEEAENQVVPWAAAAIHPPILTSSSSISSRCGGGCGGGGLGAKRNSDLLYSDDEIGCSNSYRPSKRVSRDEEGESKSRSTAIIESIMRLHGDKSSDGDDLVFAISNMSRDHSR